VYAAVFGEELQQCIVFSQQRRYNGRKATGPGYFRWPQPGKGEQAMKISYKPLWKTLIDKNLTKKDLRLQAHLTTNHIANMGKGEHISMQTLIKICETLNCDIADVIALVPDDDP
jgi:putative transcriptional regulator